MDAEDQISPVLYKREEFPLFGKEGLGEIFATICLFNHGLFSKKAKTSLIFFFM